MPHLQGQVFFFCRECDQAGYQPFLLSNTSGLQFYIKQTTVAGAPAVSASALLHSFRGY